MINIYEIMQVAVTPVFLLAGIGSLLISMTNRLGRIKDRIRILQRAVLDHVEIQKSPIFLKAISKLTWRSRFCYFSISLAVSSGLFVCIVILCMFIQGLYGLEISQTVAFLFMLCIALLIFSLVFLVIEIYIATRTIHEKGEDVEALIHRQQR